MGVPPHRLEGIYDRWVAEGKPRCDHRRYDTIQDMGVPPEEYVCLGCGLTWDMGGQHVPPPRGGNDATSSPN